VSGRIAAAIRAVRFERRSCPSHAAPGARSADQGNAIASGATGAVTSIACVLVTPADSASIE
jgi:hypothetical protein